MLECATGRGPYSGMMIDSFKSWRVFVVLALIQLVPAEAASEAADNKQREAHQRSLFASFDQNGNGRVSRQEFVDVILGNLFREFDKNKNGRITRAEFFKHARDQEQAKKEYPLMDAEEKGHITLKDVYRNKALIQQLRNEFAVLDKKKKGYVTLEDLPDLTPDTE